MIRINSADDPQEIDKILFNKWGIRLFKVAQIFSVSPMEMFLQRNDYPFTGKEIKEIKHVLGKMKSDLMKGGRRIRRITKIIWDFPEEKVSDDQLIKEMHLDEFMDKYIHRFEVATRYLEKVSFRGGGGWDKYEEHNCCWLGGSSFPRTSKNRLEALRPAI